MRSDLVKARLPRAQSSVYVYLVPFFSIGVFNAWRTQRRPQGGCEPHFQGSGEARPQPRSWARGPGLAALAAWRPSCAAEQKPTQVSTLHRIPLWDTWTSQHFFRQPPRHFRVMGEAFISDSLSTRGPENSFMRIRGLSAFVLCFTFPSGAGLVVRWLSFTPVLRVFGLYSVWQNQ